MATAHKEKLLRQQMIYRIEDSLRIVRSDILDHLDSDELKNVDILMAVCKSVQMVLHLWDEDDSDAKKKRSASASVELECLLSSVNRDEDADPTRRLVTMVGDAVSVLVECWPPQSKGPRAPSLYSGNEHPEEAAASKFEDSGSFGLDSRAFGDKAGYGAVESESTPGFGVGSAIGGVAAKPEFEAKARIASEEENWFPAEAPAEPIARNVTTEIVAEEEKDENPVSSGFATTRFGGGQLEDNKSQGFGFSKIAAEEKKDENPVSSGFAATRFGGGQPEDTKSQGFGFSKIAAEEKKDEKPGSFLKMRGGSMRAGSGGFTNTGFGGGKQEGQGGFGGPSGGFGGPSGGFGGPSGGFGGVAPAQGGQGGFGGQSGGFGGVAPALQQTTPSSFKATSASPFQRTAVSRKTLPPNFPKPKIFDTRPLDNEDW